MKGANHSRFHRISALFACIACYGSIGAFGLSLDRNSIVSRRGAVQQALRAGACIAGVGIAGTGAPAMAEQGQNAPKGGRLEGKLLNLSNEELAKMVTKDVEENQFMVCADLTRSIYDESATFTDEIDTYEIDQWIKGTKRLFVKSKSNQELVPGSMKVTDSEVTFRFTEYLTFNIPLLQPKVYLSGEVILKRDLDTGLITSYREKWDQDVNTVLRSAQLGA